MRIKIFPKITTSDWPSPLLTCGTIAAYVIPRKISWSFPFKFNARELFSRNTHTILYRPWIHILYIIILIARRISSTSFHLFDVYTYQTEVISYLQTHYRNICSTYIIYYIFLLWHTNVVATNTCIVCTYNELHSALSRPLEIDTLRYESIFYAYITLYKTHIIHYTTLYIVDT